MVLLRRKIKQRKKDSGHRGEFCLASVLKEGLPEKVIL